MRFELEALFYEKKGDAVPRYRVPIGIVTIQEMDYFKKHSFKEAPENTYGCLEYIKERVKKRDLEDLTQEDYVSEMLDVWYSGKKFNRVGIKAMEIDVIDNEGTIPPKGFFVGGIFVMLGATDYFCPVTFIDGDPYHITASTNVAKVNMGTLKRYFDVITQSEVAEKIRHMRKERWHNFEELGKWIRKVLSKDSMVITIYSDDFEIHRAIDVSKERDMLVVYLQDLGPGGFEDERCLYVPFRDVKTTLGFSEDFEVLRWFARRFNKMDAFDRIEEWLSENEMQNEIRWNYYSCRRENR